MRQKSTELLQSQPPSFPEDRWKPANSGSLLVSSRTGPTNTLPPPQIWKATEGSQSTLQLHLFLFPSLPPSLFLAFPISAAKNHPVSGVLCPRRCCCLVWGQGGSSEEGTDGRLVGVLASWLKTWNSCTLSQRLPRDRGGGRVRKNLWSVVGTVSTYKQLGK